MITYKYPGKGRGWSDNLFDAQVSYVVIDV